MVFIPYCTSDLYQGNHYNVIDGKKVPFRGRVIVEDVIRTLYDKLKNADDVIFAGASAGAVGIGFNADLIGQFDNARVLLDSIWFDEETVKWYNNFVKKLAIQGNDRSFTYKSSMKLCNDNYVSCYPSRERFQKNGIDHVFLIWSIGDPYSRAQDKSALKKAIKSDIDYYGAGYSIQADKRNIYGFEGGGHVLAFNDKTYKKKYFKMSLQEAVNNWIDKEGDAIVIDYLENKTEPPAVAEAAQEAAQEATEVAQEVAKDPTANISDINEMHKILLKKNSKFRFGTHADPKVITLGPKKGGKPGFKPYKGKHSLDIDMPLDTPILAPIDMTFIGFKNNSAKKKKKMKPYDDLQMCFESNTKDWPGMIVCFYHLRTSPLMKGHLVNDECSRIENYDNTKIANGEGRTFFLMNDAIWGETHKSSRDPKPCEAELGKQIKRGEVIAFSGQVGKSSGAAIKIKVKTDELNPLTSGKVPGFELKFKPKSDPYLHWVQPAKFFYWKCFTPQTEFPEGVLAYPFQCNTATPTLVSTLAPAPLSFTYSLEKIPGSKNHSPEGGIAAGTWWGYNQSKIVRFRDTVYTYVIDNDNNLGTKSLMTLYKKQDKGNWEKGASMPCSVPGNILIDSKGGLHVLVHEPENAFESSSLGSLEYYYFKEAGIGNIDSFVHETIISDGNGNETVNKRIGATISEDDTIAFSYGLGTTQQFYYKNLAQNKWTHSIAGKNLGHNFYYPFPLITTIDDKQINTVFPKTFEIYKQWDRKQLPSEEMYATIFNEIMTADKRAIGKASTRMNYSKSGWKSLIKKSKRKFKKIKEGPYKEKMIAIDKKWGKMEYWLALGEMQEGFAILAIQDDYVVVKGQANNPYHIAIFFERDAKEWSHEYLLDNSQTTPALTYSQWQTVDISDIYLDTLGNVHAILKDRITDKWLHYRKSNQDNNWSINTIDTLGNKWINWIKLIEIENEIYYTMYSWNDVLLMDSNSKKMINLDMGKNMLEGIYPYISSPRTGTSRESRFVDILLLNGSSNSYPDASNYYLKMSKDYLLQELLPIDNN